MDCSFNARLGKANPIVVSSSAARRGEIVRLQLRLPAPGFTARDRSELARWADAGRRTVLFGDEDGTTFAMLYDGSRPWASWAMARQDGELLVWNCVTFADLGRFGCMLDALAALCGTAGTDTIETGPNVIAFATAQLNRQRPDCGM